MSGTARRGLAPPAAGVNVPADKRFLRRPDARPGRRRWPPLIRRAVVTVIVGFGLLTVFGLAGRAALQTPALAVHRIEVRGNSRLATADVLALVDGLRGHNILLVDFEDVRRQVMDSPWVAGVRLSRVLPRTIRVQVIERVPMAIARLDQQLYLVDDTGIIIGAYGPAHADLDLPVVDGLVRSPKSGGAGIDPDAVRVTDRFLRAVEAVPALRARVSQLDVRNPRDVVVLLDGDPARLHVGDTRFVERLTTYLDLGPTLASQVKHIDYVDLRFDEQVYVKPRAAGR